MFFFSVDCNLNFTEHIFETSRLKVEEALSLNVDILSKRTAQNETMDTDLKKSPQISHSQSFHVYF